MAAGCCNHDDVIKWKHFPRYWPFVRGIHRSPVNCPHKGQWRGALMFPLIWAWINGWVNNREAGDLRRYRTHYDVIVMIVWDWWADTIMFQREYFSRHNLTLASSSAKCILGPVFITMAMDDYFAWLCTLCPAVYSLCYGSSSGWGLGHGDHALNLILRKDYIDLKDNNQFDVYSLYVSCEIFAGNMLLVYEGYYLYSIRYVYQQ